MPTECSAEQFDFGIVEAPPRIPHPSQSATERNADAASLATSRRKIDAFEPLVNGVEQSKTRRGGRRAVKSATMIARTMGQLVCPLPVRC